MAGRFISFEGIDGSGKSTQARLLADRLPGDVVLTREPGGAPGAEEIRALLLTGDPGRWSPETETALFTAARRDHLERTIRPALARGATVISDRFADSTRVYQGAARGDLRALVDALHGALIGVEPDRTLIFDMDPAAALARSLGRIARDAPEDAGTAPLPGADGARGRPETVGAPPRWPARGEAVPPASAALRSPEGAGAAENRFESLGLPFQRRLREGFRALAAEFPARCRLIDASGTAAEVAARVDAALS